MSRRYGTFTIPGLWLHEYRSEVLRVMGKCAVVRAEHLFEQDAVRYWALSDHFREIAQGEMAPTYQWYFTDDGGFWCEENEVRRYVAPAPPSGGEGGG